MSNYLSASYFVGELHIPNITGSSIPATANYNNLAWFIGLYEPKFLELLLGEDLYAEFLAGMAVGSPAAKWTNLKNQIFREVTVGSDKVYYSPAANYVYYHFMRDKISITTLAGEVRPAKEGAVPEPISNTMKMVLAWNNMAEMCAEIWEWLEDNIETYTTFDPYQDDPFEPINMFNI